MADRSGDSRTLRNPKRRPLARRRLRLVELRAYVPPSTPAPLSDAKRTALLFALLTALAEAAEIAVTRRR